MLTLPDDLAGCMAGPLNFVNNIYHFQGNVRHQQSQLTIMIFLIYWITINADDGDFTRKCTIFHWLQTISSLSGLQFKLNISLINSCSIFGFIPKKDLSTAIDLSTGNFFFFHSLNFMDENCWKIWEANGQCFIHFWYQISFNTMTIEFTRFSNHFHYKNSTKKDTKIADTKNTIHHII